MPENIHYHESEIIDKNSLVMQLTSDGTSLEDRISITKKLFSEQRKQETLASADKDAKGKPVRYFRLLSCKELESILDVSKSKNLENPVTYNLFNENSETILHELESLLKREKVYETFKDDFGELNNNPTLQNYRYFIQHKLPRNILFKLHKGTAGGLFSGITGLKSISVGAPYQPPVDPCIQSTEFKGGLPVIELSIPSNKIFVDNGTLNDESEKEVDTLEIEPEWIIDIYNGINDFSERFVKKPDSSLYPEYKSIKDKIYTDSLDNGDIWKILSKWKDTESIANFIPTSKIDELDINNPIRNKPLLEV
ncbi:MAG: hypothetical protein ACD_58C00131G0006 [uncultured bacterium]|nr:MAG: hypothetical protein ACD_58C00131G0006 [uncultured bacterium]